MGSRLERVAYHETLSQANSCRRAAQTQTRGLFARYRGCPTEPVAACPMHGRSFLPQLEAMGFAAQPYVPALAQLAGGNPPPSAITVRTSVEREAASPPPHGAVPAIVDGKRAQRGRKVDRLAGNSFNQPVAFKLAIAHRVSRHADGNNASDNSEHPQLTQHVTPTGSHALRMQAPYRTCTGGTYRHGTRGEKQSVLFVNSLLKAVESTENKSLAVEVKHVDFRPLPYKRAPEVCQVCSLP